MVIIILVLALSGLFGGIINFFMNEDENKKLFNAFRSIIFGLGASFMVPVFLIRLCP